MDLIEILRLYVSPAHNYFGHHGREADEHPTIECNEVSCVEGRGIEGDRFFDYKPDYKGQISFFADEVYQALRTEFDVNQVSPAVFRRNVLTRGTDLNSLIGREFFIQGVRFLGTGECKPCYWMNTAFHPGAEASLQSRGGLRAKILTSGRLRTDAIAIRALTPDFLHESATAGVL
ncbi:MAG TPA: MOSC domain-containing protein [Lacunisphaera sp.]|jgi:MOSC domain-containing protein YiiM